MGMWRYSARQTGVALVVCMLMMLAVLMLGASGARIAMQEEKASRQERDRLIALQAAEAALKDAEADLEQLPRAALFQKLPRAKGGFCESGLSNPLLGLCRPAEPAMFPVWQKIDAANHLISVPYGYFTGSSFASGGAGTPAKPPRYLIEVLPTAQAGKEASVEPASMFRITAIGYGTKETTQVLLQSYYRKSSMPAEPKGRLGWREILSWEELRDVLERG